MALARWQATIVDDAGNIVPSASVEVREEISGLPLASIFSDRDGATPLGNPITADANGFVAFHVAGGAYQIIATSGAFEREWRYVAIGTNAERDFDDSAGDINVDSITLPAGGIIDFAGATLTEVNGEIELDAALVFGVGGALRMGGSAFLDMDGITPRLQLQATNASNSSIGLARFSNTAGSPFFAMCKSRGVTEGSHVVAQNADVCGEIYGAGSDGVDFENAASIAFVIDGEPATAGDITDMPGAILLRTTPNGSATLNTRWVLLNGGAFISPIATGSVTGNGEINAVGVFDDGVLLTSMPLSDEFARSGNFSVEEWEQKNKRTRAERIEHVGKRDAKGKRVKDASGDPVFEKVVIPAEDVVPEHKAARRLKAIIDEGVDLRDPKQFCARMKRDKVLPGMPTEQEWQERGGKISLGEMHSSMWAAMDLMGIMVEKLSDRIVSLEAQVAEAKK